MLDLLDQIQRDAVMLFVTIDPITTLAIFVPLTAGMSPAIRRRVALRCTVYSAIILLAFIVVGEILLSVLDIRLSSFQFAGGILLFLFGIDMVFGSPDRQADNPESDLQVAVFPLAVPSIAGPAAIMAVVLLTDNNRNAISQQAVTAVVLLAVLGLTYVTLLFATQLHRIITDAGASVLRRVLGMVLAALAAEHVLSVLEEMFQSNSG